MRYVLLAALALGMSLSPVRADAPKPIRALFICGGCCHDYVHQKNIITLGIADRANIVWVIAHDPDKSTGHLNPIYASADWAKDFDVIVHDECSADVKDLAVIAKILQPHKDGLPAVFLHCAMHSYRSQGWPKEVTPWFELTGLQTTGHGAQIPIAISFVDKESPITKGLEDWTTIHEELYNNIAGKLLDTGHPLARGKQTLKGKDGAETTIDNIVAWTNTYNGKTKVFGTTIGHNNETCSNPQYLDLVTRGLLWTTGHITDDGKPAAGYEAKK